MDGFWQDQTIFYCQRYHNFREYDGRVFLKATFFYIQINIVEHKKSMSGSATAITMLTN